MQVVTDGEVQNWSVVVEEVGPRGGKTDYQDLERVKGMGTEMEMGRGSWSTVPARTTDGYEEWIRSVGYG